MTLFSLTIAPGFIMYVVLTPTLQPDGDTPRPLVCAVTDVVGDPGVMALSAMINTGFVIGAPGWGIGGAVLFDGRNIHIIFIFWRYISCWTSRKR